ncbi:MAG: hypothetical protein AAGG11_08860 [Pseudomonadota bacterium]
MKQPLIPAREKPGFLEELRMQRWDDHRYYHHSRINQSLHLLSAICFLTTYALLVISPSVAAFLGWIVAMTSRQIGHFFFEPKTYDEVNKASHEHKEDIKVGYNLFRKRILHAAWALTPVALYLNPTGFGLFEAHRSWNEFFVNLGILWIWLAVAALAFRTVHLFFIYNLQTGLVWATKILTDPFHDFKIYFKSPWYLMRGELIDPMPYVRDSLDLGAAADDDERAIA